MVLYALWLPQGPLGPLEANITGSGALGPARQCPSRIKTHGRHFGKWDDQQLAKTMNATIYAERFSNVMKELHTRRKHGNDAAVVAWWKKVL